MKWYAISGTWRYTNEKVEQDVREIVRGIIENGDGIVTGAAYGVDSFAISEALKIDSTGKSIKSCIPVSPELYKKLFYKERFEEGNITESQYEEMSDLLNKLILVNYDAFIFDKDNKEVNKNTHFKQNDVIIDFCDELYAFQVNDSEGTQDAINKAKELEKPVHIKKYSINIG